MAKQKHSGGPWKNTAGIITTEDPNAGECDATVFGDTCEEAAANARLIAAAPELLSALEDFEIQECPTCGGWGYLDETPKDACTGCGGCGEIITGGWPENIRKALTKATGDE